MISETKFDRATGVVEAGIDVAMQLFQVPQDERPKALEAHAILIDGLRGDDLSQDALLDLLGVALMIIAYERTTGKCYRDA